MKVDELVSWLAKNNISFFHFTDTRNLPSIRESGLLSMREMRRLHILPAVTGGNQWSLEADVGCGMDAYVHLCFRKNHPMEFLAKKDGRIQQTTFLKIDPAVLLLDALVCDGVSNKAGVVPGPPVEKFHELDWEVLYQRTDWTDPLVKERLKVVSKYEVIVPTRVPKELIKNLNGF